MQTLVTAAQHKNFTLPLLQMKQHGLQRQKAPHRGKGKGRGQGRGRQQQAPRQYQDVDAVDGDVKMQVRGERGGKREQERKRKRQLGDDTDMVDAEASLKACRCCQHQHAWHKTPVDMHRVVQHLYGTYKLETRQRCLLSQLTDSCHPRCRHLVTLSGFCLKGLVCCTGKRCWRGPANKWRGAKGSSTGKRRVVS